MTALLSIPWFKLQPWEIAGPVKIQPFGVLVALGILLGSRVAERYGERHGIARQQTADYLLHIILIGLASAMLLNMAAYEPEKLVGWVHGEISYPGLSSFGGFFGGTMAAIYFRHKTKLSVLHTGDIFAYAMPYAWFFGRMGCFVVHDHPGIPTDFFLGVENYNEGGVTRHDLGLYEVIWSAAVIGLFWWLERSPRKPGFFLALIGVLYAPIRFGLDYLRADHFSGGDVRYGGFTPGQYWAVLMLVACVAVLMRVVRMPAAPLYVDGRAPEAEPESGAVAGTGSPGSKGKGKGKGKKG